MTQWQSAAERGEEREREKTPQRISRGIQRLAAAAALGGAPSLPRSASAEFAQGAAARRAAPGPTGRCRAARGAEQGVRAACPARLPTQRRRAARSRAGPRRSRRRRHRTPSALRRAEPRSAEDQGEKGRGPQALPGERRSRATPAPAQARAFPGSGPRAPALGLLGEGEGGASRGQRGAWSGTYTTALEIIQDTIFLGGWGGSGPPPTSGAGGRGARQAGPPTAGRRRGSANGRPRALAGGPRTGALGGRARCLRSAGRAAWRWVPRPSPPAGRAAAAEPTGPAPALR